MVNVVFVMDTSVSMNQKIGNGMKVSDCAKSAIEHFIKVRMRYPDGIRDRYLLVTCGGMYKAAMIRAGWKDPPHKFFEEVKSLRARDLSNLGAAVKLAFDLLNQYRFQDETYGYGRSPSLADPGMVVFLTDDGALTTSAGVEDRFILPLSANDMTLSKEPYRWDQRLFGIVIGKGSDASKGQLRTACENTGGWCTTANSLKLLLQAIEGLASSPPLGVLVTLEQAGRLDAHTPPIVCPRVCLKCAASTGHWPIPEAYLPTASLATLPPRSAHPRVLVATTEAVAPWTIEGFPVDKYDVENCELSTLLVAATAQNPRLCWPVYVHNSMGDSTMGRPFGYLSVAPRPTSGPGAAPLSGTATTGATTPSGSATGGVSNTNADSVGQAHVSSAATNAPSENVVLTLLPYDFPRLMPILAASKHIRREKGARQGLASVKADLERYMTSVPSNYVGPLRSALKTVSTLPTTLYEGVGDLMLSKAVIRTLQRTKHRGLHLDAEKDKHLGAPGDAVPPSSATSRSGGIDAPMSISGGAESVSRRAGGTGDVAPQDFVSLLQRSQKRVPSHSVETALSERTSRVPSRAPDGGPVSTSGGGMGISLSLDRAPPRTSFSFETHIPRTITRAETLESRQPLRAELLSLVDALKCHVADSEDSKKLRQKREDSSHMVPVAQMGNYQEVLASRQPLRDPLSLDDSQRFKVNFGNRYRTSGRRSRRTVVALSGIDEADIDATQQQQQQQQQQQ
eukprot:Rmarinus@m.20803